MNHPILDEVLQRGGVAVFVLLPCSLLVVAALFQAMLSLRRGRVLPQNLAREAAGVQGEEVRQAWVRGLARRGSPLARAVWQTLRHLPAVGRRPDAERIDALASEATRRAADELYDGLAGLTTLYSIGPYVGVMGAIVSMLVTLRQTAADAESSAERLALGIEHAMLAVLWGLGIALGAYLAARWMERKVLRYERRLLTPAILDVVEAYYSAEEMLPVAQIVAQPAPRAAVAAPVARSVALDAIETQQ